MVRINKLLTPYNYTKLTNKRNMWIVIHYVGAVSTAKANAKYFYTAKRGASANYFVDENEIWQVVDDMNASWHIGAVKYYNSARNNNSIGIEMCCKRKGTNGEWYFEPQTIKNTIELVKMLAKKYGINTKLFVCRHFDCTRKNLPCSIRFWWKRLDWLFKQSKSRGGRRSGRKRTYYSRKMWSD